VLGVRPEMRKRVSDVKQLSMIIEMENIDSSDGYNIFQRAVMRPEN